MILRSELNNFLTIAIKEVIKDYKKSNKEDIFIGTGSIIKSIEVVQIISLIEDKLEKKGYEGVDLFEKIFEYERLTFSDLLDLIQNTLES